MSVEDKPESAEDQAMREGIEIDTPRFPGDNQEDKPADSQPDAKTEESSTSETEAPKQETVEESPKESESPATEGEPDLSKVPAHLHDVTRKLLDEKKELRSQLEAKEKLLNDSRISKLLAQPEEAEEVEEKAQPQAQLPEDQAQALAELNRLQGIDDLKQKLDYVNNSIAEMSRQKQASELDQAESSLKQWSQDNGFDYDTEINPQLTQWLAENPDFQGLGAKSLDIAHTYFKANRMAEIAERKANLRLIQQQNKQKTASIETQGTHQAVEKPKDPTMEQFIERRLKESGGLEIG